MCDTRVTCGLREEVRFSCRITCHKKAEGWGCIFRGILVALLPDILYEETAITLPEVYCKGIGRRHRESPAGLPIEQVLGEYSLH